MVNKQYTEQQYQSFLLRGYLLTGLIWGQQEQFWVQVLYSIGVFWMNLVVVVGGERMLLLIYGSF